MRSKYIIITIVVLLVYYTASYYVGWRLLETWQMILPAFPASIYWMIYVLLTISYIVGRVAQVFSPGVLGRWLIRLGAHWLGFFFYLLLGWGLADFVWLCARWLHAVPDMKRLPPIVNGLVLLAAAIICIGGVIRARHPRIKEYTIKIEKGCSLPELHIVAASDTHLGLMVGKEQLEHFIDLVNRLNPDLILLPGDILDENVGVFIDEGMPQCFRRLKPSLGMFACIGSHEYIWGDPQRALNALALAGITVLKDEVVIIADSIYLAGRDDIYKRKLTGGNRKSLPELLQGCDHQNPILLMDHYPANLEEAHACGVDLQLSGHTHKGQIFPLNWITRFTFDLDAGYRRSGSFHVIVSSGYGTWLLPMRVGTTPEILSIRLQFIKDANLSSKLPS